MNLFKKSQEYLIYALALGLLTSMALISASANLIAVFATVGWFICRFKKNVAEVSWPRLGPDRWMLAFLAIVTAGALFIPDIPNFKERWSVVNEAKWVWFMYAMSLAMINSKFEPIRIVKFFTYLLIPVAAYGIFQSFSGLDPVHSDSIQRYVLPEAQFLWRARGFFRNPITYGYNISMVVVFLTPFLLYGVYRTNARFRKLLIVSITLGSLGFILSFSRGAWTGTLAALATVMFLWNKKSALRIAPFAAGIIVLGLMYTPGIKDRMGAFFNFKTYSISLRFKMWRSSLEMFKDHPLLGVGAARVSQNMQAYNERLYGEAHLPINSHNNFLDVLAGTGVFGFIAWIGMMFIFFFDSLKRFWRATSSEMKALHLGCVGAQICFHVGGLTQSTFLDREPLILFCLLLSISITAEKRQLAA